MDLPERERYILGEEDYQKRSKSMSKSLVNAGYNKEENFIKAEICVCS